jgi:hypothetical protein
VTERFVYGNAHLRARGQAVTEFPMNPELERIEKLGFLSFVDREMCELA